MNQPDRSKDECRDLRQLGAQRSGDIDQTLPPRPADGEALLDEINDQSAEGTDLESEFPDVLMLLRREAKESRTAEATAQETERLWAALKARAAKQATLNPLGLSLPVKPESRPTPPQPTCAPRREAPARPASATTSGAWVSSPWSCLPVRQPLRGRATATTVLMRWLQGAGASPRMPEVDRVDLDSELGRMLLLVDVLRRLKHAVGRQPDTALLLLREESGGYLVAIREDLKLRRSSMPSLDHRLFCAFQERTLLSRLNARTLPGVDLFDFMLMARLSPPTERRGASDEHSRYWIGRMQIEDVTRFAREDANRESFLRSRSLHMWREDRISQLLHGSAQHVSTGSSAEFLAELPWHCLAEGPRPRMERLARVSQQIVQILGQEAIDGSHDPAVGATAPLITVAHKSSWPPLPVEHSSASPEVPSYNAQRPKEYVMWAGDVHRDAFPPRAATAVIDRSLDGEPCMPSSTSDTATVIDAGESKSWPYGM